MTIITKDRGSYIQEKEFDENRFKAFFNELVDDTKYKESFSKEVLDTIYDNTVSMITARKKVEAERLFDFLIREINGAVTVDETKLVYLSATVLRRKQIKQASRLRGFDYRKGYGDYYSLVKQLVEQGKYDEVLLEKYTEDELNKLGKLIVEDRDKDFDYSGLLALSKVFLSKVGKNDEIIELPQERYLTTAIYAMQDEPKKMRHGLIKKTYDVTSKRIVGLATPMLKNLGTPHGSGASCQIVTVDDNLNNIFDSFKQIARFSQEGSGLGVYLGFLRSAGSWIRGVKGVSSGVVKPCGILSKMAEYVDQTGTRKAGIAAYLPVWHGDVMEFLELKLKTGSQENRAHSIHLALTIPDEFMRRLENRELFTLFDPYEVKKVLGFDLNRLYDKEKLKDGEEPDKEKHAFTYHYRIAEKADLKLKKVVKATDIYGREFAARMTGGEPYRYYSDTAARNNPNNHVGMPYGSNLCSEIVQNMAFDKHVSEELQENGYVVTGSIGEGLVTCNLTSQVLHRAHYLSEEEYQEAVDIQFRIMDNVISLHRTPVPQATHTNNLYRATGAGMLGFATTLTEEQIRWESDEASEFADKVFKRYLKAQIKASHKLAKERGSYPLFEGSDWNTGEFFDKRGLVGEEWDEYRELAKKGLRNGYLTAVAPTSTNSVITGGSPSIDPLQHVVYSEKKANLTTLIVPPNYSNKTKFFYKSGYEMDEMWALKIIASAQKYVDQAISHNYHISKNTSGSELLRLDMYTWNSGIVTTYYTRSEGLDLPDDCIMCEG